MTGYRFAVSECTTYHQSFEQDLITYKRVGVQGIGIWESKIAALGLPRALELFHASGLDASFCFPDVPSVLPGDTLFHEPRDSAERVALMCAGIRRLAAFRPAAVALYAGPPGDDPQRARRLVVESLRRADEAAAESDTRLVLEILRPSAGGSLASTIEQGLELIDESGARTIDILIDVWHVADYHAYIADIERFTPRIKGLQVCDRPREPRSWMDRRLPGAGAANIAGLLRALRAGNFDGWYELEIFSDDGTFGHDYADSLWKADPAALVTEGLAAFDRLFTDLPRAS